MFKSVDKDEKTIQSKTDTQCLSKTNCDFKENRQKHKHNIMRKNSAISRYL